MTHTDPNPHHRPHNLPHAIHIAIDETLRARARADAAVRQMSRTRASQQDAYIGTLGELVWAKLRYGDWSHFDTLHTRGKSDDAGSGDSAGDVEIKTSKTRISTSSHLMVREDYALKRQPAFYVLVLVPQDQPPQQERDAYVCGWASHAEVIARPPIERISRHTQRPQGFRCYEVGCGDLKPLHTLPFRLSGLQ